MADKLFPLGDGVSFERYKDMGDGTFAKVVSLSSPPKRSNEIGMRYMGQSASENSGAGRTWCMKQVCPDKTGFYAVRVCIRHASTSSDTTHRILIAATETAAQTATALSADINRWRPVAGGVEYSTKDAVEQYGWVTVTWNGQPTFTPPATTGADAPVDYWSDWVTVQWVPRADGGTFPLAMLRDLVTGTGAASSFTSLSASMATETAANGGFIMQGGWAGSDFVTTINNLNASNPQGSLNGGIPVIGMEFRCNKAGATIQSIGDSITQEAIVVADGLSSAGLRVAAALSAAGFPCGIVNYGFATRPMNLFAPPAIASMASWKPTAVIIEGFSPNGPPSGGFTSDAAMRYAIAQQRALVQSQITAARNIGAAIIVTTGVPTTAGNIATAVRDNMRKAWNAEIMAMSGDVTPFDYDAIVTNGASPARLSATYDSGDQLHPNEAGVAAKAAGILPIARRLLGVPA